MTTDMVIPAKEGGSGAWAELEAGMYRAQVIDIEDVGVSEMFPADGPRLKFSFALLDVPDDDGQPVSLFRWCSQKVSGGAKPSNLWKWAEAMGVPPQVGQPFAVSTLMDRECQVVVELKTPQAGGDPRPNITSILPQKSANGRRAPLAARVATPAAAAAATDSIGPCIVCDAEGTKYTDKGKVVCDAHAAMFQ